MFLQPMLWVMWQIHTVYRCEYRRKGYNQNKRRSLVKVTLDAYGSQKFEGIVTQVNSITNNALTGQTTSFSTSGTYTKTTQLIPIKIKLVNSDIPLENIIGTNATVNIKVK